MLKDAGLRSLVVRKRVLGCWIVRCIVAVRCVMRVSVRLVGLKGFIRVNVGRLRRREIVVSGFLGVRLSVGRC